MHIVQRQYFRYLWDNFEDFCPVGATQCTYGGEVWCMWPQNWKFTQLQNINISQQCIPCVIFKTFYGLSGASLQSPVVNLIKGFQSYGDLKLGVHFPKF